MKVAVCTLFEGSYGHGVVALVNSLWARGYEGVIYIGHREVSLPNWLTNLQIKLDSCVQRAGAGRIRIEFRTLSTDMHLANYKPTFMRSILLEDQEVEAIFYFDPDICVVKDWRHFVEWVSCGICLCEDVNSPLPENHPKRIGWRLYYSKYGRRLQYRTTEYYNSGYLGLVRSEILFLDAWISTIEEMADELGTLSVGLATKEKYKSVGFADCFINTDQDAMNAALESSNCKISAIGKEGMAFASGDAWMPHAIGDGKPWKRKYLRRSISGQPPRLVDKVFWNSASGPARSIPTSQIALAKLMVNIGSLIGRFYRKA